MKIPAINNFPVIFLQTWAHPKLVISLVYEMEMYSKNNNKYQVIRPSVSVSIGRIVIWCRFRLTDRPKLKTIRKAKTKTRTETCS